MSDTFSTWFPSPTTASLFVLAFALWAASELFNSIGGRIRRPLAGAQHRDRGSYWVIALVVWGSLTVSFVFRSLHLGAFRGNAQYLGLGMVLLGIIVREWAVLLLGKSFTVVVTTAPTQMLVTRGPYRWVRHPAYTGMMLTLVGFALALGTWVAPLVVLVMCIAGLAYRVRVEESALLALFGDEYRQYMAHTWRFLPGF